MMVRLLDLHVVDRVFDFAVIVAIGVPLQSGAAWLVSRYLPRKAAARHLVLSAPLAGSRLCRSWRQPSRRRDGH
jgi:hypothetical protein